MLSKRTTSALSAAVVLGIAGIAAASHPVAPLNLQQQNGNGSALAIGGTTINQTIQLVADSDGATCDSLSTYVLEFEVRPTAQGFSNTPNYTSPPMPGNKPNCVQQTYPWTQIAGLAPGPYKWQVREKVASATGSWTLFNAGQTAFVVSAGSGITVAPASINFGDQEVGKTSSAQQITINSTGMGALQVQAINVSGPFAATGITPPVSLAPGTNQKLNVSFTPLKTGAVSGTVTIISDSLMSPTTIALSGNGTVAQMQLQPGSHDFLNVPVGTTSAPKAIVVSNLGSAPLTVTNVAITGPFAAPNLPPVPFTVPAMGTLSFNATFSPLAVGTVSGSIRFTSNDPNSPSTLTLVGTGTSLGLNALPNPANYGNVAIAGNGMGAGLSKMIALSSNINQPITIQSIQVMPGAPEWTIDNPPMLPLTVPAMGSVTVSVTEKPQGHGALMGSLMVTSDAPNSPLTVALTASGIGPKIVATPDPLDFGPINVMATGLQLINVQNAGETALKVTSASFAGANAAEFKMLSSLPITVQPATTAQLAVRFTPTAAGMRSAKVTLVNDDTLQPTVDVNLTGTGATPKISVMPAMPDFGMVNVGSQSPPVTITIANAGQGNLTISSLTLGGPDAAAFQVAVPALPMIVAPGGSRTIAPVFAPLNVGKASAKLTLVTDDPNTMNLDVPLTGTGLAAMIAVAPNSVDFGSQIVGKASPAKMVTITNSGSAPLTINSLSISGPQASTFGVQNPPMLPVTLAPNGTQSVSLIHTPAAVGMDDAKLVIGSDDPKSPNASVSLTGVGVSTVIAVSPMMIDFGSIRAPGKSAPQSVTVSNTGSDPITLIDAELSGKTPALFSVDSAAGVLMPGGQKTVNITFSPTMAGDASAVAAFKTNDKTIPAASVSLTGKGAAAKVTAQPMTVDFGNVVVGLTATRMVTLSNVSGASVKLSGVTSDNQLFTLTNVDTTNAIPAAGKTTFAVTFSPNATGPATAKLAVSVVGGMGPEITIQAMGSGTMPMQGGDAGTGGMTPGGGCEVAGRGAGGSAAAMLAFALVVIGLVARRRK